MSKGALIAAFFVVLFVLHQDFWWKDDARLVAGVLPISLAYHVFWTLAVALGWYGVTRFCWPEERDDRETRDALPPSDRDAGQAPSLPFPPR